MLAVSVREYVKRARSNAAQSWLSRFEEFVPRFFGAVSEQKQPSIHPWDLATPLMYLAGVPYTVREACGSATIMGAPGSGKSSGSMRTLALSMLTSGWGGLVLVAKRDEPDNWRNLTSHAGRADDVVWFGNVVEGCEYPCINFLDYELRYGAGAHSTANLVDLLWTLATVVSPKKQEGGNDAFWTEQPKLLLTNLLEILRHADGTVSLPRLYEVFCALPQALSDTQNREWTKNPIAIALEKAGTNCPQGRLFDFHLAKTYLSESWPKLDPEPRSALSAIVTSLLDTFLRYPLRQLFCGETTIFPEDILDAGKIVIFEKSLSVKNADRAGIFAQVLMKRLLQRAAERKAAERGTVETPPCFIWQDECQFFLTPHEADFLQTARAAKVATVLATQNIPNMLMRMDEQTAKSIFGNTNLLIFHANGEEKTNKWASETIAQAKERFVSYSGASHGQSGARGGVNVSYSAQCPTSRFVELVSAQQGLGYTEAVIFAPGKRFPNAELCARTGIRDSYWTVERFEQDEAKILATL